MTTRMAGIVVAEKSNLKIRAANGTATASATATAVIWVELNGNGKDHLKSGPKLSEELGAPQLSYRKLKNSVPIIKGYLADPDSFVRANAARELGRHGDKSGYTMALGLADDKDIQVQSSAVEALGTIGNKAAEAKLRLITGDAIGHQHVRFAAERALAQLEFNEIPSGAQLDFLKKTLADLNWGRRTWAASELARRYPEQPQAIGAIIDAASKDRKHPGNEEVRQLAIRVRTAE